MPFKYNLGNFIEALDKGANVLLQAGGGCRYGYYAEVQEQILRDMGYEFNFYSLVDNSKNIVFSIYDVMKKLNPKLNFLKYLYYVILTLTMIYYMDKIDIFIRKKYWFEREK
jgi:predicted nucleotide-binding protein (sugar kinase/HSP70/actin superfamily)